MPSKIDQSFESATAPLGPEHATQGLLDPSEVGRILWEEAKSKVKSEELKLLDSKQDETPEDVIEDLQEAKKQVESHHHGIFDSIIGRLNIFYEMASTPMSFAPQTIQIVWTVFGLLMKFVTAYKELRGVMIDAADAMSDAMFFCGIYISQCRQWTTTQNITDKVRGKILNVYCEVLCLSTRIMKWAAKSDRYGRLGLMWKVVKDSVEAVFWKTSELSAVVKSLRAQLEGLRLLNAENSRMFVENAFRALGERLKDNTDKISQLASNFGLVTEQNQAFFDDLAEKQKKLLDVYKETEELRSEEKEEDKINEEYMAKLEWLKAGTTLGASQPDDQRQEKTTTMSSGTCEWILAEKDFVSWKAGANNRIIWVFGKAGSGKTFLCSSVITNLAKKTTPNDSGPILTYFFCKIGDFFRSQGQRIMLHLLTQLFGVLSSLDKKFASPIHPGDHLTKANVIRALVEEAKDKKRADELDLAVCARIFQRIVRELDRKVFIVLDALDECTDRQNSGLFDALTQMVGQEPHVHLLIASRDEDDIRGAFMSKDTPVPSFYTIEVNEAATRADIASYVAQSLARYRLKDPEWARREILERSEGIFQYAAMALRSLESDPVTMRGNPVLAIQRLPKGLNKLYEQRLSEMNSVSRRSLKIMLRWLAYADRSVKLIPVIDEIVERYRQEEDQVLTGPISEETEEEERETARDFWNDLYPDIRDFIRYHDNTTVIEAQHKSILDWIRSPVRDSSVCVKCGQGKAGEALTWDVSPPLGQLIMARGVMETLTHPRFLEKYLKSNDKNPSRRYELKCWWYHVRAAERASGEEDRENDEWKRLYEDIDKFVYENSNRIYFENWQAQLQKHYLTFPEQPLSIAAKIGSLHYFKRQFDIALNHKQNDALSQKDSLGLSPLHWACRFGDIEILKFILDKDQSQVNVPGGREQRSPLHLMLSERRSSEDNFITFENVKLLLFEGARADIQDLNGDTALHAAVSLGDLEICKEILQREEVDVNAQDKWGKTPIFMLADSKDLMGIARLMMDAGANLQCEARDKRTLLLHAVQSNSPELASLVLEKAPNIVNVADSGRKETALHCAARALDKNMVELLLEKHADICRRNSGGFTPLQVALVSFASSDNRRGQKSSDRADALYMFLEKTPPDETDVDALNTAIEMDLPQVCKRWTHLAHHLDRHGWSPLMLAKQAKRETIYEMMLSNSDAKCLQRSNQAHSLQSPHSPTEWDRNSAGGLLAVVNNGVTLSGPFDAKHEYLSTSLVVQGNHPVPPGQQRFYFEIEINDLLGQVHNQKTMQIGYSSQASTLFHLFLYPRRSTNGERLPCWIQTTEKRQGFIARHGEVSTGLKKAGFTYGDVVGAGIDFTAQQIFFTKNGERLDYIFEDENIKGRLFPVVSLYDAGVKITANFGTPGSPPFKYKWEGYHQNE